MIPVRKVVTLGQVFTPDNIVQVMLSLRQNHGSTLEPACGEGAFSKYLDCTAVEIEADFAPEGAIVADFFEIKFTSKFDTIIGNPPYVQNKFIRPETRKYLPNDHRSNLYLFFIRRCLDLLADNGELIFITPRDFLHATSARSLNQFLCSLGTITHVIDLGDKSPFKDAAPNCIIWRFQKGDFSGATWFLDGSKLDTLDQVIGSAYWTPRDNDPGAWENRDFVCLDGQLRFTPPYFGIRLGEVFEVKVGGVSGLDEIFANDEYGNMDFVYSKTATTGQTRRMVYSPHWPTEYLEQHKSRLITRGIRNFNESNWWQWGRGFPITDKPRIYVNAKTRQKNPFFIHECQNFDGSVLALFPRHDMSREALESWKDQLNAIDWNAQGFVCDGRFIFGQRSLENAIIPWRIQNESQRAN